MFSLSDLRSSSKIKGVVSSEEGRALAGRLRVPLCETSSLTQTGLRECFDTAVSLGVATEGVATNRVGTNGLPTKSVD